MVHIIVFCFVLQGFPMLLGLPFVVHLVCQYQLKKYLCKILKRVKERGGDLLEGGIISRIYGNAAWCQLSYST